MNETRTLADFLSALAYEALPEDVIATAKLCVLDTVGVALASTRREWSQIVTAYVAEDARPDGALVWGTAGTRATAALAALANGTSSHGIEMDDRVPTIPLHPGSNVVPAAIALAELRGIGGAELLVAVVAGYELGIRVGRVGELTHGLHAPGHKGHWAAVGAAARALGLDAQQTLDAYGILASMAAGIVEFSEDPRGTMVKRLHAGLAAKNGVLAASLAQRGLTAPATAIEGEWGYARSFLVDPDLGPLVDGLGTGFKVLEREIKPYSAWGGSHTVIECAGALVAENGLNLADIAHVRVGGSTFLLTKHELRHPQSIMAAQFSLPFLTALALANPPAAFADPERLWTDATLQDPEVTELENRIELEIDREIQSIHEREHHYGGARITLTLVDGRVLEKVVYHSKGTLANPMSKTEIEEKFIGLAAPVLGETQAEAVIAAVDHLDEIGNIGQLTTLLVVP